MLELLTEPLGYPFVLRGLAAVLLVGVVAGAVGTFVVLRGMAFLGDALAHAILPGIAVGYLVQGGVTGGLFWWALGTAVAASMAMGAVARRTALRSDTAIGIVFAAMFALGIALVSARDGYAVDLAHLLFGNLLGVSSTDLVRMALLGGAALALLAVLFKELVLVGFDPGLAASLHLPVRRLEAVFLVLVSITVVVSLQAVGVALTMAMLVTPPATALLLTRHLGRAVVLACAFGAGAGLVGVLVSYHAGIAPGAAVVLAATAAFAVVAATRARTWLPAASAGLVISLLVGACVPGASDSGIAAEPQPTPRVRVVATTSIVADLVARVAGPEVEVALLVPPGTDPHSFEPTAGDAGAIAGADLVFASGMGLEDYLPSLIAASGTETELILLAGDVDDGADPHVWLDPTQVVPWTATIGTALSEVDPAGAAGYAERQKQVAAQIAELDGALAAVTSAIPAEDRLLVTDHAAWTHFAARYDFEILGTLTSGPDSTIEPTAKHIAELMDQMQRRDIGTVFIAARGPSRAATMLAADVGAELVPLYVEALGPPGSGAETYDGMMRLNAERIEAALGRR